MDRSSPSQERSEMEPYKFLEIFFETFVNYLDPKIVAEKMQIFQVEVTGNDREKHMTDLLDKIMEDDSSENLRVLQFFELLQSQVSSNLQSEIVWAETEEENQNVTECMESLMAIVLQDLLSSLNSEDVQNILQVMKEKEFLTERTFNQVNDKLNHSSVYSCCMEMMKSVKKRRPKWPFVFCDALKKRRPELFQSEQNSQRNENAKWPLMYLPKDEVDSPAWEQVFDSGALSRNEVTTEDPQLNRNLLSWKNDIPPDFSDGEDESEDEENEYEESEKQAMKAENAPSLNLREYQKELAAAAIEGHNVIICAPTGSGKTRVSVHIMLHHLQEQTDKPKKIAFLARTVPLVMQQYKVISKYLPNRYKITHVTGDSKDSMSLHLIYEDKDVIVMTPKILENHLSPDRLPHLGVFTMLIFDECHHTREEEPYNTLMRSYLKTKASDSTVQLPKIVGLTASIGIEKATTVPDAKKHILKVCANLDVDCISTVTKHVRELEQCVPVPREETIQLRERDGDDTVEKILSNMKKLEEHLQHHADELMDREIMKLLTKIPSDRKSQQYGQWIVNLHRTARSFCRNPSRETNISVRSLIILSDYLRRYNVALETLDLVQLQDVMSYLENCFLQYKQNVKRCTGEEIYYHYFEELKNILEKRRHDENPNLTQLTDELEKNLVQTEANSRSIIFVRTRALTDALTSWFKRCGNESISNLNATIFTGTGASEEQGGMTQAQQNAVVEKFRSGEVRVLVATSVGEEGLDIPECSLVIKYNHVGNEITTVQTRGRSRKVGGLSILMAMDPILNREAVNRGKAKVMAIAIKEVGNMSISDLRKSNKNYQKEALEEIEIAETMKRLKSRKLRDKGFKMVCLACRKVSIPSQELRTIYGSHRVVLDRDFVKNTMIWPLKEPKYVDELRMLGSVKCLGDPEDGKHCFNTLGSIMVFRSIPFVALGIKNMMFETEGATRLESYKKWKEVPYIIREIDMTDIKRCLEQLDCYGSSNDNGDDNSDGSGNDGTDSEHAVPDASSVHGKDDNLSSTTSSEGNLDTNHSLTAVKHLHAASDESVTGLKTVHGSARAQVPARDSGLFSHSRHSLDCSVSAQSKSLPSSPLDYTGSKVVYTNQVVDQPTSVSEAASAVSSLKSDPEHHETELLSMSRIQRGVFMNEQIQSLKEADRYLEAPSLNSSMNSTYSSQATSMAEADMMATRSPTHRMSATASAHQPEVEMQQEAQEGEAENK